MSTNITNILCDKSKIYMDQAIRRHLQDDLQNNNERVRAVYLNCSQHIPSLTNNGSESPKVSIKQFGLLYYFSTTK